MAKKAYECKNCGKKVELEDGESNLPECCELPMEEAGPLPVCETSDTAEHSRLDKLGEPCNDGRAGKV
ncbi:MAG: hypothetical protein JSU83_08715 [Deltaproteobacteria bacterium]|nr:MAG: hypothetical protein JSU83_08715 [Deltaproteobacteria bacterium]